MHVTQQLSSKVTGQQGWMTYPRSTRGGLAGEIFPSAAAQAEGFIILSLARLQQCQAVEGRDRGNISEMRFSTQGSDTGSHEGEGGMTAFSQNL